MYPYPNISKCSQQRNRGEEKGMTRQLKLSKLEQKEYDFRHEIKEAKPFQVDYIVKRYENWARRYQVQRFNQIYQLGVRMQ